MKGVFTTRITPSYDDDPATRYHFPRTYLRQVERTVGDFIVYYEPGRTGAAREARGGRQSYFAVAFVDRIVEDQNTAGHFYALVKEGSYLEFDQPVSFRAGAEYFESALARDDGGVNKGAFGRAVRNLDDAEFNAILTKGFRTDLPDFIPDAEMASAYGVAEEQQPFERPIIEAVVSRPFRDRAFSRQVRAAYDRTCAFTGLRILNGLGRPEVQAAHIQSVEAGGPDTVRNGLALSSTFHWMFDRGIVSLEDDGRILAAKDRMPSNLLAMMHRDGYARLPNDVHVRPNPRFLRFHRESVFKG